MAGMYQSEEEMKKAHAGGQYPEPAMGIPYGYPPAANAQTSAGYYGYQDNQGQQIFPQQPVMQAPPQQGNIQYYHQNANPHQGGMIPPNALYGPPNGIPLRETFFADTPAPFECPQCGKSGLTEVKSRPSLAACVACMMSLVGVCFLFKGCDCLWHKEHYCQNCGNKVASFNKSDPCLIVDPVQWHQHSFAIPS